MPTSPRVRPAGLRAAGPINYAIAKVGARAIRADDMHLFSTLGRTKRLFLGWLGYSGMLMPFGALKRTESETVIVRVAYLRENAYELGHHRRIGARAGLTATQFERIFDGSGWNERSAALLEVVTQIVADRSVSDDAWARLAAFYDERRLVEIVLLATNYDGLATTIDILGIEPER
ncbi:carboxymuconolactone decarboxylase family protein [Tsukamurella spumae]|uniref:Carboxymuconolactone decarboxylase family protein n=1 Tax=Tsukamurella spumae TaxID=44753 RepID=A0A846X3R2_9ACTN|nr:carboxymuconolactone decarboxylase family protein [Tsukamurella spumae]NKY18510.1 carboxymuconolactone decarboxylase family protein [Tsukamurella spumae]